MSILKVLAPVHRPALKFEGCNTHSGYVHQGMDLGGSYEVGLTLWGGHLAHFHCVQYSAVFPYL